MTADPNKLKSIKEISRPDILFAVAALSEAEIFVGSSDFKVHRLNTQEEKAEPSELAGHTSYVTGLELVGDQLVSAAYDGKLKWWDLEKQTEIRSIDAHAKWIRRTERSHDGKSLATVSDDMVCRVWDTANGKCLHELKGHQAVTPNHFPSMLYCCAFSHDDRFLATADRIGHVVVWDLKSGKEVTSIETPEMYTWDPKARIHSIGGVRSLAFSPDGKQLVVGGMGHVGNIDHLGGKSRIEIFAWEKGERLHELIDDSYKGLTERLVFHPSGKWFIAAGGDNSGFVKCIDATTGETIKDSKAATHVHDVRLADEPGSLVTVGHGKIVLWQL
ncbi:WD40 repeat domain-containing protein [Bremerella sp.]|uniref:WD40 repeat domain-containing protein n=1 Tax=Bremerella sp. TaxID=2795602 RepID=UPI00391BCB40